MTVRADDTPHRHMAGTHGDGCHADVIEPGRNGGVAVWDYAGKRARKKGWGKKINNKIMCVLYLDPKRQSKDPGGTPTYVVATEILVRC